MCKEKDLHFVYLFSAFILIARVIFLLRFFNQRLLGSFGLGKGEFNSLRDVLGGVINGDDDGDL